MPVFGFIGTGNMGGALAVSAAKGGAELILANRTKKTAEALAEKIGGTVADNKTAARLADYIFLGVKPQMIEGLMDEIRPVLAERKDRYVLVSMLAGKTVKQIQDLAGSSCPVIRLMPNMPVSIGEGVVLYASDGTADAEMEEFLKIMASGGKYIKMNETLIDAGTSVSGCGPAYVDLFIEALADGAVMCGVPRAQAYELAGQMIVGSAKMALEHGGNPGVLKDQVCSPAGSTIAGVKALEDGSFRASVINAVLAAYNKNKSF